MKMTILDYKSAKYHILFFVAINVKGKTLLWTNSFNLIIIDYFKLPSYFDIYKGLECYIINCEFKFSKLIYLHVFHVYTFDVENLFYVRVLTHFFLELFTCLNHVAYLSFIMPTVFHTLIQFVHFISVFFDKKLYVQIPFLSFVLRFIYFLLI